jgi:hypothetical protein
MNRVRLWSLLGLVALAAAFFIFVPPIHQDPAYHNFADQRAFLSVPHCLDVLSNIGFLVVGECGLIFVIRKMGRSDSEAFLAPIEIWAYFFFFAGVFLTAFGSAYYHLAPDDARLVYDRLPMTIGFMALLAAVISERVDTNLGSYLLGPLMALGLGSVLYWRWTELGGNDDLRLYGIVQFGSIAAILPFSAFWPSRYTRGGDIFLIACLYALAKLFEDADRQIFALGHALSGHTLKHFSAAFACYFVLRMLERRRPKSTPVRQLVSI